MTFVLTCPTCGALPGKPCIGSSNRVFAIRKKPHALRLKAAERIAKDTECMCSAAMIPAGTHRDGCAQEGE